MATTAIPTAITAIHSEGAPMPATNITAANRSRRAVPHVTIFIADMAASSAALPVFWFVFAGR
jgi:hypothetical protein